MAEGDRPETRLRLLRHARDLYLEAGPSGFSLREVARRSEVSAAAVYRHFKDKDALLGAVCEEGFRVFSSYLLRSLAAPTPLERLRAAGEMYRRFGLEHPRDYRVIFMGASDTRGEGASIDPSATFQFLVDRVRECMEAKVLARGDEPETAAIIWAHVHGLVSLRLCGQLEEVGDDDAFGGLFVRSLDGMLRGLMP